MAIAQKDSPEVVEFRTLYSKLRDWCEDLPDDLPVLCETDPSIKKLSFKLNLSCSFLKYSERLRPELFCAPIDPEFIREWRDYEKRYESILDEIFLGELLQELDSDDDGQSSATDQLKPIDKLWRDEDAVQYAAAINHTMRFAHQTNDRWRMGRSRILSYHRGWYLNCGRACKPMRASTCMASCADGSWCHLCLCRGKLLRVAKARTNC